jgi:hypothetical protein
MSADFLPTQFPARNITDGDYLYRALGSFWTKVFQDKSALRGYTIGMAEEAIQAYYNLIETINKYSIRDIQLFHKEKWLPLKIKKSAYNKAPFVFSPKAAKFGIQPEDDMFYAGQLFRFGFPKQTNGQTVFSFTPDVKLGKLGTITDRVIAPTVLLQQGVDFVLNDGTLVFNKDIFNLQGVTKTQLIDEFGNPVRYKDADGVLREDELIVLWMYHAEIDENALADNYGVLFDLPLPSSEGYKELLKSIINLFVSGPSISSLSTAFAALCGIPIIVEPEETVESFYSDETHTYVVTDKHVYSFSIERNINSNVQVGRKLYTGDVLTDELTLLDCVSNPHWWITELKSSKLAFSSHVFAANVKNQLIFNNNLQLLTYTSGTINFPVEGRPEDVLAFQAYINQPDNKQELLDKLGMSSSENAAIAINPLDFVFTNFFKNNTFLVKCNFTTEQQLRQFFSLFGVLKPYLPPHVYFLVYLNLKFEEESLTTLNQMVKIPNYSGIFCADGSDSISGSRPGTPETDTEYYKDYINRMFCVSVGPYREGQPLHADGTDKYDNVNNLDELTINNTDTSSGIFLGKLRTYIPELFTPPGDTEARLPSTKEIQSILLIDF